MGACGCGDFRPFAQMPGPEGAVYAVEFYPGCDDCEVPIGFIVHRFTEAEAATWDVLELPQLPFDDSLGADWKQCAIPFAQLTGRGIAKSFYEWWQRGGEPGTGGRE